ncbi:MAG: IS110 family transposase [Gammaproteobacteria bacterium]
MCRLRRDGKDQPQATGVYSLPLALALHSAPAIEVMVVNPKAIKHFATARLQRGKTDSLDAGTIPDFLEVMPFRAWQPPGEELLELQHICRRIIQLNTELTPRAEPAQGRQPPRQLGPRRRQRYRRQHASPAAPYRPSRERGPRTYRASP